MLSDQNERQDVIIQSCMCIFCTLILYRTPLPFKMISIVFCFVDPKQYPQTQKWTLYLLERGQITADFKDRLILRVVTNTGGSHHTWGHNYSPMEKGISLWMGDTWMSQERKLFPRLSEWQTQALFFPQTMDWLHSFVHVGSPLLPLLMDAGLFLFLKVICVQGLLYIWISLEASNFFWSKNSFESYFKLLRLAWILLLVKCPVLVEFNPRSYARHLDVCISWRVCVVNPIISDFLHIHAWSGHRMCIISGQKMLEINLVTLPT